MYRICTLQLFAMLLHKQIKCKRRKSEREYNIKTCLYLCNRCISSESEATTNVTSNVEGKNSCIDNAMRANAANENKSKAKTEEREKEQQQWEEEADEEENRYVPQWFNKQLIFDEKEFDHKPLTYNDIFPYGRHFEKSKNRQEDVKQVEFQHQRRLFNFERTDMYERYKQASEEEENAKDAVMGKSNNELFPNWSPDEEAPREEFMQLNSCLQAQYIYNRLSMAERRIRLAPDFGSHGLSVYLYYGDLMLHECESLLNELGWMTKPLQSRIKELKELSLHHKLENDLM